MKQVFSKVQFNTILSTILTVREHGTLDVLKPSQRASINWVLYEWDQGFLIWILTDPATESSSVAGSHKRSRKLSLQWLRCFSKSSSIRFLNSFTDSLFTVTEGREFLKEITLWEKKYFLVLRRTWFFTRRMWCSLVQCWVPGAIMLGKYVASHMWSSRDKKSVCP